MTWSYNTQEKECSDLTVTVWKLMRLSLVSIHDKVFRGLRATNGQRFHQDLRQMQNQGRAA